MEILARLSALGLSGQDFDDAKTETEPKKKIHDALSKYFEADIKHCPYRMMPKFVVEDHIAGKLWINAILFAIRDWNYEIQEKWMDSGEIDPKAFHMVITNPTGEPSCRLHDEHYLAVAHHPDEWGIFQVKLIR